MVNEHDDNNDIELEVTNEESENGDEPDLVDMEEQAGDKMKKLRARIKELEEEKQTLQDELQRAKAEFLNARRRIDEDRARDRIRNRKQHIEELLPLCDSFQMAMNDKEAWEKAEPSWRKGVEGIHTQLMKLLQSYDVVAVDPTGEPFDPHKHEAIGTEPVTDAKLQDTVVSVVQRGYEVKHGDTSELIRPARVTTGELQSE